MRLKSKNYQNSRFTLALQQMLNLAEHLPLDSSCLDLGCQVKYMMHDRGVSAMI